MPISMLRSGLVCVQENDSRTNDDREKDEVPKCLLHYITLNNFDFENDLINCKILPQNLFIICLIELLLLSSIFHIPMSRNEAELCFKIFILILIKGKYL